MPLCAQSMSSSAGAMWALSCPSPSTPTSTQLSSGCCSCNPLLSCHPLWQLQGLYAEDTFYAVHCPAIPPYYLKSLKVVQVALGQVSSEGIVYHPMSSKFSLRLAYALHCTVPNLENLLYCSKEMNHKEGSCLRVSRKMPYMGQQP